MIVNCRNLSPQSMQVWGRCLYSPFCLFLRNSALFVQLQFTNTQPVPFNPLWLGYCMMRHKWLIISLILLGCTRVPAQILTAWAIRLSFKTVWAVLERVNRQRIKMTSQWGITSVRRSRSGNLQIHNPVIGENEMRKTEHYYDLADLCHHFGLSPSTIRRKVRQARDGQCKFPLPIFSERSRLLWRKSDILNWTGESINPVMPSPVPDELTPLQ